MKTTVLILSLMTSVAGAALAETPYEADQRQQMEKYQREHGVSPQVAQSQRWAAEWRAQHPGQPLPNEGQLQKLHRDETQANIQAGFAKMRARRQAELQREYQISRAYQQRQLAAQHITWTPQQWQAWDRRYDQAQHQKANDYLRAVQQAGEINQAEREHDEQQRIFNSQR